MIPEAARKHPWAGFLHARMLAIAWLRSFNHSDKKIALDLSMDEEQVYLIRTNPCNAEIFESEQSSR